MRVSSTSVWRPVLLILALLFVPPASGQDPCPYATPVMVPMSDGTLLRARVTLPEGDGPWPVILCRTPYYDNDLCWNNVDGIWEYGYAVVNQNTRGRYGSEGENLILVHDAWGVNKDGYDCVQWILQQPWCNGVIGMYGGSMRGAITNMTASSGPPNVFGEWIPRAPADYYKNGVLYYGGALRWDEFQYMQTQFGPLWASTILEHPTLDSFWQGLDVTSRQSLRDHPVVIWAGWYDSFLQSCLDNYITLQRDAGPLAREYSKLIISLIGHGTPAGEIVWPAAGADPGIYYGRPLFDDFLKGEGNAGDTIPRVAYYLMGDFVDPEAPGNVWRFVEDWPVPAQDVPLYLHGDGALRLTQPTSANDSITYTFDPDDPVPTLGGAVHGYPAVPGVYVGSFDQRPVESRPDVIVFETEPLTNPVEVVGKLWMYLWASSDCVDTDFTAKLTDVYPDGTSMILVDGIIRARARNSLTNHELMTPGTPYEFAIDLWSTAMLFNTGHRIRLAISSSNFPRFTVNPNTGADLALEYSEMRVANNTIYLDADHPSRMVLPITGPDSDGDNVVDFADAFPMNPDESTDNDSDGMGDIFEQSIIDADPSDSIETIDEVLPHDDFDGDRSTNLWEFRNGTNPVNPDDYLGLDTLVAVLAGVSLAWIARRKLTAPFKKRLCTTRD